MQGEVFVCEKKVLLWALIDSKNIWKTNQEISLTNLSLREMPAPASKMEEWQSPMKSEETTCKTSRHKWRNMFDAESSDYLKSDCLTVHSMGKELGYLVLRVTQHSLHGSHGGLLDGVLDGLVRRRLGQTACQVHHWHVSHWHPEGHACQLAEETERQTSRIRRRLSSAWLETRVFVLTRWAQGWPCPRPWRHRWKRGWCSDWHNGHRARPWHWGRPLSSEWLCKRGP